MVGHTGQAFLVVADFAACPKGILGAGVAALGVLHADGVVLVQLPAVVSQEASRVPIALQAVLHLAFRLASHLPVIHNLAEPELAFLAHVVRDENSQPAMAHET